MTFSSVATIRVHTDLFGNGPPVLSERSATHEEAEMARLHQLTRDVLGRSRYQIRERPDLLGRGDVVLGPREQEDHIQEAVAGLLAGGATDVVAIPLGDPDERAATWELLSAMSRA